MIEHHGPNRFSFLWGRSTQNSRIERLWVDTGINFVCRWKAFFVHLEDIHYLDVGNPHHLWLLHFLFLGKLNDDCQQFQHDWNQHPISKRGHNQSPLVRILLVFFLCQSTSDLHTGHVVPLCGATWHLH